MTPPHTRIALVSQKPGVAKTTTATLLGFELSDQGYRVGAVDGDRKSQTMRKWLNGAKKRSEKLVDGKPQGTPVPFAYINGAHDDIVEDAENELPEHDVRIYDIQGGDDVLARAVMADVTDVIICTTMSDFDRSLIPTSVNTIEAGLMEHQRLDAGVRKWVLFGRVNPARAARMKDGQMVNTEEFEGYCDALTQKGLYVFDSWLPARKEYEKMFRRHPADIGLSMTYIRNLIAEMKEEKIIRG